MRPVVFPYKTYRGIPCPIVSVGLQGPLGWIHVEAYVDSGAFLSIFSVQEAAGLGVDYRKGKPVLITVGDGRTIPVYTHRLPLQLGSTRFPATIGFSPGLGVGFNLLGRQDIFTHFDITFSDATRCMVFRPVARHHAFHPPAARGHRLSAHARRIRSTLRKA